MLEAGRTEASPSSPLSDIGGYANEKGKSEKRIQGTIHDHFEEGKNHSGKHVRHRKFIDTVYE